MNKPKLENVKKALKCFSGSISCSECAYNQIEDCRECVAKDALALLCEKEEEAEYWHGLFKAVKLGKAKLEDENEMLKAEIERLKHSKGVAQVNIINEIANRMQIKEFNSNEIATGYSWAINDLLKLLLELKKKVVRGNKDDQM